jgi:hypothetical protein
MRGLWPPALSGASSALTKLKMQFNGGFSMFNMVWYGGWWYIWCMVYVLYVKPISAILTHGKHKARHLGADAFNVRYVEWFRQMEVQAGRLYSSY